MRPSTAHLKTLREETGLTLNEAADLAGVSLRTWKYWESPERDQPARPDVIEQLERILAVQDRGIDAVLEAHGSIPEDTVMTLTRYRTDGALARSHPGFPGGLSAHTAMIGRCVRELRSEGRDAIVVWDDDPAAATGADFL
ncbi:DUF1870 family protein [Gulosibacter sp. 10]|uniref:Aca2/YdiL-like domain-containing protein n=1 Tax=Gulosibacter sp. 10 TaxID=1255570 RepID=UPI000B3523A5|nr:DUF1870 family protein [Gulosibacter sp. 10]